MNITLLIDHLTRELTLNIYQKSLLKNYVNCKIDHQDFRNLWNDYDYFKRTREPTDYIVTPSYNVKKKNMLSRALRQKSSIIINHSEQIFSDFYNEEKLNLKNIKAYNRHIAAHIVWGEDYAKKLIKFAKVNPQKIYIAGNPKLDLATRLNNEIIGNSKAPSSKTKSNTFLFISDFNLADYEGEKWLKFKKQYSVKTNLPMNEIYKKARLEFVEWIILGAKNFPECKFLVRPHPGESLKDYSKLEKYNNVKITGENEFSVDVSKADKVFSFTSTSIFEIVVMGKPYWNLDLVDIPMDFRGSHYSIFNKINKEQYLRILGKKINESNSDENHISKIDYYMYKSEKFGILRNAIALKDIVDRRMVSNYNMYDYLIGKLYLAIPILKKILIKLGYFFKYNLSIDNKIEQFSKQRYINHINGKECITSEKIEKTTLSVSTMISEYEVDILSNMKYKVRQTEHGNFIDLN